MDDTGWTATLAEIAGPVPPALGQAIVRRLASDLDGQEMLAQAAREARETLASGGPERDRLETAVDRAVAGIPNGARFLAPSTDALLEVARLLHRRHEGPAAAALRDVAAPLASALDFTLAASDPDLLADGLGGAGGFLDSGALSHVLEQRPTARTSDEGRDDRLTRALGTLRTLLDRAPAVPPTLVTSEAGPVPDGWRVEITDDPCAAAPRLFDEAAAGLYDVIAAVRVGRLDAAGLYEPERHDPWLDTIDWRHLEATERALLPLVVVLLPADRLVASGLTSLARLLRSGRPIQVVIDTDPLANPGAVDALSESRFECGLFGVSQLAAVVQHGSFARPRPLLGGLERALAGGRPGLHVVDCRGDDAAVAAVLTRSQPLFLYDPGAARGWAHRLDASANPEPEDDFVRTTVEVDGDPPTLTAEATAADYLFAERGRDEQVAAGFTPVPDGTDPSRLTSVADGLRADADEPDQRIPVLWAIDESDTLHQVAVSRAILTAAQHRLELWHTLQEMSGARSEYAREAVAAESESVAAHYRVEIERIRADHEAATEQLKLGAARDVVDRLTSALLDVEPGAFADASPTAAWLGADVDTVAATLRAAIGELDPSALAAPPPPADEAVERLAGELRAALGQAPLDPAPLD